MDCSYSHRFVVMNRNELRSYEITMGKDNLEQLCGEWLLHIPEKRQH